jgi:hypothetical protein
MIARCHWIVVVAASLSLAAAACGDDTAQSSAEAGGPLDATSSEGAPSMPSPTDGGLADAQDASDAPSTVWVCASGGGGPQATAQIDPLPVSTDAGPSDAGAAGASDAGASDAQDSDAGPPLSVEGTATFEMTGSGVDLTVSINGCANGAPYPIVIHEGSDCASAMSQGPEWDPPRGEGITSLICLGNSSRGTAHYTRPASGPKPWSVGGSAASDVVGHVILIVDPVTMRPVACGPIVLEADAGVAPAGPVVIPRLGVLAQAAGLCTLNTWAPDAGCPDPGRLVDCACTHCDLSACLANCSDYVTCLQRESASCANDCPMPDACSSCLSRITACELGFCIDVIGCAVPTPGGPCSKLEACCELQGPRVDTCLYTVNVVEKLGGDTSCTGLMHDQDFLTNGAYDPQCNFDE